MSTEDDFQRLLDANPDDHHTRLVFADWLDDRGDPRAAGYRALGVADRGPRRSASGWYWYARWPRVPDIRRGDGHSTLVGDWWDAAVGKQKAFASRREAENAAALAFATLPAARRAELLDPEPVGAA